MQVGEIVAQQFGGAAGVGIFRREDDHRIDRQAELHQVAVAAMQEVGRKPRLLARHLADRHHLVDRRHVAERQHVIERLRGRRPDSFRPERWRRCRRRARLWWDARRGFISFERQAFGARFGVAASTSRAWASGPRSAARAAYSPAGQFRNVGAAPHGAAGLRACRGPARSRARAWRAIRRARSAMVTSSRGADMIDAEMLALVAHHHDAGHQVVDEAEAARFLAGALDLEAQPAGRLLLGERRAGATRIAAPRAPSPCRGRRHCAGGRSARARNICGRN